MKMIKSLLKSNIAALVIFILSTVVSYYLAKVITTMVLVILQITNIVNIKELDITKIVAIMLITTLLMARKIFMTTRLKIRSW